MTHRLALALSAAFVLAACQPATDGSASSSPSSTAADTPVSSPPMADTGPAANPLATPPASVSDRCNAARATTFVGRTADAATRAELTAAVAPVTTIRWVGPGMATTEDYSDTRLNVMLDAGEVITEAHCG